MEVNDPWLADLVLRAEVGETIVDMIVSSQTSETYEADSNEQIKALTEMICGAGEESTAALLVLMGTLQKSSHPKVLANTAKHFAFTRCGELNVNSMVDAQISVLERDLFAGDAVQ